MVLLCVGGCSAIVKRPSAQEYYNTAETAYLEEDYEIATDNFRELLDQYPLNPYAEESQLKIAYSYYLDEEYALAIASFGDFERAYPISQHLPFVEYYRGMSWLEQMRSIDRDQSVTHNAYRHFQLILDRHPQSTFALLAEEKSRFCRESIASNELIVGQYYVTLGHLFASRVRLRSVIEKYPETDATTDALASLEDVLDQDGEPELAALAAKAYDFRATTELSEDQIAQLQQVSALVEDAEEGPSAADLTGLPEPSIDPLLQLVTELRKEEVRIREASLEDRRLELEYIEEQTDKAITAAEERKAAGIEDPKPWGINRLLSWGDTDEELEEEEFEEDVDPMISIREWMPDWVPL
jgi:outer membrane protein assembly factor BamD